MAQRLIDYTFGGVKVANPDGSLPITFSNAKATAGPGATPLGTFEHAVDLGLGGKAAVAIDALKPDLQRFCIRIVFQAQFTGGRQNLVESTFLPFSMFLQKGTQPGELDLVASVAPKVHGWSGPSTRFAETLKTGVWYTADLAYDTDTAALFIDGALVAVHAFPNGAIEAGAGHMLFVGTWVDGQKHHFNNGKLAALQWYADLPTEIESALDEWRTHAQWFITRKFESVKSRIDLGQATGPVVMAGGKSMQPYERGAIMYHDSIGAAFEMHGAIYDAFKANPSAGELGYLVRDESPASQPGGRKSVFSKGAIYWSSATGAVPVKGQMYLDYENLGE